MLRALILLTSLSAPTFGAEECAPKQISASHHCCDGAMGNLYGQVTIKNISHRPCVLQGVPGIEALSSSRGRVDVEITGNADVSKCGPGSNRIVLKPGRAARFWFVTSEPNFDHNRCSDRVRIRLPGQPRSEPLLDTKWLACGPPDEPLRITLTGFRDPSESCGGVE